MCRPNLWPTYGAVLAVFACFAPALAQPVAPVAPGAPPAGAEGASAPIAPPERPRPAFTLGLGVGQTDNVGRDSTGVRSELRILDVGFDMRTEQRQRLEGALVGDLELRRYGADNLVDNSETTGSLDGKLAVGLIPKRLVWEFEENYGQTRVNPLEPIGPNNRQPTSIVSTGPQLDLPVGERNSLQVGARLADRRFADSDQLNGRQTAARFGFLHALSRATQLGFTYDSVRTEFDNDQQGYDFKIFSVVYSKQLATGDAQISIGRGKVNAGTESDPTTVARLEWRRNIGARSRLSVWAGRELTDAGELFRSGGILGGSVPTDLSALTSVFGANDSRLQGVVLSQSPLRRSAAGTHVDLVGRAFTITLGAGVARDRFELDDSLDNDSSTLELGLARDFARRWRGDLQFSAVQRDFVATARDYEDRVGRLTVTRNLARRSRVSVGLERNRRSTGLGQFTENVYLVSVGHDFGR